MDEVVYDETFESLTESRGQMEEDRDNAMEFMEEYYVTPEPVDMFSETLDDLLDPTSTYMLQAQADSKKSRDERGYLDSGFNEGMGTVAAIDNAFDVALSDAYVNITGAQAVNEYNRATYSSAYEASMSAMLTQHELTGKEFKFDLDTTYDETVFEHAKVLQQDQDDALTDRINFFFTNKQAEMLASSQSIAMDHYLYGFNVIMASPIRQEDKYDMMLGLSQNVDWANATVMGMKDVKVEDNPYGIDMGVPMEAPDIGERTDEQYVWSVDDATTEFEGFWSLLNEIRGDIHEVTNHQERDASSLWTVMNDKVFVEMRDIDKTSQLFVDKMEYYNRTKMEVLGSDPTNDEIEKFYLDMYLIGKTVGNPVYGAELFNYYAPYTATTYTWDSESETIIATKTQMPGSTSYYEAQYAAYDSNDSPWMRKPAGYDAARAACQWPMQWSRGQCTDQG